MMNEFGSSVGSTHTDAIHGSEFGPLPSLLIVASPKLPHKKEAYLTLMNLSRNKRHVKGRPAVDSAAQHQTRR